MIKIYMTIYIFLVSIVCFSQEKFSKIQDYSLGNIYNQIKNDDFKDFKQKCGSWVDNVKYQYAVQLLDNEKNNNTLINQIDDRNLKNKYVDFLSNIRKAGLNVAFYDSSDSECPLKKYNYVKTILDYYEKISKLFSEAYNIYAEERNAEIDFNNDLFIKNKSIIDAKKSENKNKLDILDSELEVLNKKYSSDNPKAILDNKIISIKEVLNIKLIEIDKDSDSKIKKLPLANFSVNKQKIIKEASIKKNNLKKIADKNILEAEQVFKANTNSFDESYYDDLKAIELNKSNIINYNYDILKMNSNFDNSKYTSLKSLKEIEIENTINEFNNKIQILEKNRKSNSKVISIL